MPLPAAGADADRGGAPSTPAVPAGPGVGAASWPTAAMVVGGALVALQTRINGELGVRMHSAIGATTVSFAVALVLLGPLVAVRGRVALRRLAAQPGRWWYWSGGLGGMLSTSALVAGTPRVGVSLVSVCLAAGMTAGALVADRIGLGPSGRHPVSVARLSGASLAVGAVVLAASGGLHGTAQLPVLLWLFVGGFAASWQQPINGRLGAAAGDPLTASLVSFVVGLLALLLVLAVLVAASAQPRPAFPAQAWLYTGGCIAVLYVVTATVAVVRVGALRLSLATLGGQLTGAAVLDVVAPIAGHTLTAADLAGAVLALVGVVVAGGVRPRRGSREPILTLPTNEA